jgi:hypothetical protein
MNATAGKPDEYVLANREYEAASNALVQANRAEEAAVEGRGYINEASRARAQAEDRFNAARDKWLPIQDEYIKNDQPVHYAGWHAPGEVPGSYKEMLLTTPSNSQKLEDEAGEIARKHGGSGAYSFDNAQDLVEAGAPASEAKKWAELMSRRGQGDYTSPHWDDPNVVAHVTMTDRVGPNGEKTLHVDEVQSDWGQTGRSVGHSPTENSAIKTKGQQQLQQIGQEKRENYDKLLDTLQSEYGQNAGTALAKRIAGFESGPDVKLRNEFFELHPEIKPLVKRLDSLTKETKVAKKAMFAGPPVPDFPFKENEWADLALKHIVDYAAKNGYERISFTNGALAKKYAAGGGGDLKALKYWYEQYLPSRMKAIGADLQPEKLTIHVPSQAQHPGDMKPWEGYHNLPMFSVPPKLQEKIRTKGLPFLSWAVPTAIGGGIGAGASAAKNWPEGQTFGPQT